jgi:release factor glutamine methyltransferase
VSDAKANPPKLLLEYLKLASDHLAAKGVDSARLDAELLLADALGLSRMQLYTSHDRPLAEDEVDRFRALLRRRATREPVAYILGRREFWSLEFTVDRRVLIPRPETETLVDAAVLACTGKLAPPKAPTTYDAAAENGDAGAVEVNGDVVDASAAPRTPRSKPRATLLADRVLDIGTGSGAVAVALAVELPGLALVATDESAASLEVAPRNAARHGVEERIEFRRGDVYDALDPTDVFDVIVSNPPYCKESELVGMEPEVRDWEPKGALVGGSDGMHPTARIIDGAPRHLKKDGWLLLEVGTQADNVRAHLARSGWRDIRTLHDLAGRDRVIVARAPLVGAECVE